MNRLESLAYKVFLATLILTPLAFIPSQYLSIDLAKTLVIVLGTLVSAILYGLVLFKEKRVELPPKAITVTALLILLSLIVSSFTSLHAGKAFFGQGFEIGTVGFIASLFVAAWVVYEATRRNEKRALTMYALLGMVFIILALIHLLRFMFGPTFMSLAVLTSATSALVGNWNDLGMFAMVLLVMSLTAMSTLPLSKAIKWFYGIIAFVAFILAFVVNLSAAWIALAISFLLSALLLWRSNRLAAPESRGFAACLGAVKWMPLILGVLAIVFAWQGTYLASPLIQKTGTQYIQLSLPWQMTLDVVSGAVKNYPWFGIGPNHFSQAFMAYKPPLFNLTDIWSVEFSTGFGFIPTLFAAQGVVGSVLWILFLVMIGIYAARLSRHMPESPERRFIAVSSFTVAVFLWIMSLTYVPSHAMLFLTFVFTGILFSTLVEVAAARSWLWTPQEGGRGRLLSTVMIAAIVVALAWGFTYIRKAGSLFAFAGGVKALNTDQNFAAADADFHRALAWDSSDVYWQALSENDRLEANSLISTATSSSPELSTKLSGLINDGISAARSAITYDPSNYYNYLSEARVSSLAAQLKMANAYDNAVRAYTDAINLNPLNPSIYVSLAQTQAAESKFDDALQSLGRALQVKNNYLDAVYFLSQVQAAQGNIKDAITSAQVATQINPQEPILFFQLGLLEYTDKSYTAAAKDLAQAVSLQPSYANAQYFLGLSLVRLGKTADAIAQFESLAKTNPDNQEIALILANLKEGKSPFTDATPPVTPAPEKRSSLPVQEKK